MIKLLGAGSPLVDYSLAVSETLLAEVVPGGKGGTRNISAAEKENILRKFPGTICRTPGGSAANTVRAFAMLGGSAAHFGKLGNDDDGRYFCKFMADSNADCRYLFSDGRTGTGYCLSLITPDAERTMLSNLGASLNISQEDIRQLFSAPDFDYDILLMEGYLACEPWSIPLLQNARDNGMKIAVDLNNFELVSRNREHFLFLAENFVDLLFANEQEIKALFDSDDPDNAIEKLTVPLTVIKLGKDGSLIYVSKTKEKICIPGEKIADVKDTTGAGDFYAAGFLYGLSQNLPLEQCGKAGSLCASTVIRTTGTVPDEESWKILKAHLHNIIRNGL